MVDRFENANGIKQVTERSEDTCIACGCYSKQLRFAQLLVDPIIRL